MYQALPHAERSIRLLSIAPGWPSDPINVVLVTVVYINEALLYDALSYVWGQDQAHEPILCNGIPKRVIQSLEEALGSFRPLPSAMENSQRIGE